MINKTALLVKEWAEFEASHPKAELEDFCRYFLISSKNKNKPEGFLGGNVPPGIEQVLSKLMGRIMSMFVIYADSAIKPIGINGFVDFLYLNVIDNMKSPKKTEVIYANFNELSSGLLIIDRMIKNGLVTEQNDKQDKRSKRLSLTDKGLAMLHECYQVLTKLTQIFYKDMPDDDVRLCIHFLTPVEVRFAALWQRHKGMGFEEVYGELTGK